MMNFGFRIGDLGLGIWDWSVPPAGVFRSCYALWPRQIENSHYLPVEFAADNADAADFRGFFGLKKDFSAKIRDDPIFQRHPRRIERRMI